MSVTQVYDEDTIYAIKSRQNDKKCQNKVN